MAESHEVAYRELRRRVRNVVEGADDGATDAPAPATPEWTAHDVLAHLAGVADDVVNGRLDGIASEPWTAKQVESRRDKSASEILDEWDENGPRFEAMLATGPDEIAGQALFDAVTHEQDLRHALGVPGGRDCDAVALSWQFLVDARTRGGATALRLITDSGDDIVTGAGEPVATLTASRFEILRAVTGRRSASEIAAYGWDPSPQPELLIVADLFRIRADPLGE